MDEVKNMLDYKVVHYIKFEDIPPTYKKPALRSFMLITQKFFPYGDMDKLKARLVADDSQQGRHLYDFVSSATILLLKPSELCFWVACGADPSYQLHFVVPLTAQNNKNVSACRKRGP